MGQDGITPGKSGLKRSIHDDFDPFTSDISLKPTPPYDSKKEQAPFSVSQSKEWITYKDHEQHVKHLLIQPTANLEFKDKSLQGLIDTVNARVDGHNLEKIILCLTGPMGTGKSSTLNSLFSVGPIAREGDSGGSCTLTSCMYQDRKKDQQEPFLAEVNFFSRQDRRDILCNYLAAYYHANHSHVEDEEVGAGNPQSAEDTEANLDIRNEVINALLSLFGNQRECRTKQDVREFLDEARSPKDEFILEQLYAWCDSLIIRATGGKPIITISASTAGELSKRLEDFTAYAEDDSGNLAVSLTPMVSLISFYFDDPLTQLGITFLDTPGTSDCNTARKKSANAHRKNRTHSAILSDEARVKDDAGISKEVKNLRNRGAGRLVIVITRSDVIKDTTMPSGSKKDKERSQQLKNGVERLNKELNALELLESDADDAADHERASKLSKEKKILEMRVKLLENAEKAHRINMRSESNKKVLEEKLLDITPSTVPVFSISNIEYAKHMEGYKAKNTPVLTVEQTNIPALRRLISAFPNEARLNEVKHQQQANLPGLLSRIRLYTARSPSDRKADMERHVQSPMSRYAGRMKSVFVNLELEVVNILDAIRAQEQVWTSTAGRLCDKWADEFNTGVFLNLLKRDGRRRGTGKNRELNLSADLIQISSDKLAAEFRKIRPWLRHFEDDMSEDMDNLVSEMVQNLREDSNEPFMSLGPFYDYVHKERGRMQGLIKTASEELFNGIDEIRRKVTSEDEDAYLVEAMLPIYEQVRQLKGGKDQKQARPKGGWPTHRRVTFKNEVTKLNGVWTTLYDNVGADFKALLDRERDDLIERVGKMFEDFYTGFNMMCEVDDTNDPRQIKVQEELMINIDKAERILNGPMQLAYEALERAFRRLEIAVE